MILGELSVFMILHDSSWVFLVIHGDSSWILHGFLKALGGTFHLGERTKLKWPIVRNGETFGPFGVWESMGILRFRSDRPASPHRSFSFWDFPALLQLHVGTRGMVGWDVLVS